MGSSSLLYKKKIPFSQGYFMKHHSTLLILISLLHIHILHCAETTRKTPTNPMFLSVEATNESSETTAPTTSGRYLPGAVRGQTRAYDQQGLLCENFWKRNLSGTKTVAAQFAQAVEPSFKLDEVLKSIDTITNEEFLEHYIDSAKAVLKKQSPILKLIWHGASKKHALKKSGCYR